MNYMPMYYNQTHNQLLLIYIKKNYQNDLENKHDSTIEWGRIGSKEKKNKKINLKKTTSTLKNMCGSR